MSVYKPCDIRGPLSELSPELYRRWGYALGKRLEPQATVVVGGDVRNSTPAFLDALIVGFLESGARVLNLGVQPTPVIHFAKRRFGAAACAIVTSSHSPPDTNGLKWMIGQWPPGEQDAFTLEREAAAYSPPSPAKSFNAVKKDPATEYRAWLVECFAVDPLPDARLVVLDPGNGCWAGRARPYLQSVFPQLEFAAIHDRPDGSFPERNPDSAKPEHLTRLSQAVLEQNAALGIAFDGDGDRVAFVDDRGRPLTGEEATWILLQCLKNNLSRKPFVYDIKFSDRVAEAARQLGAVPTPERSGHAFIRTRMLKENAPFGAEISGHYFYAELDGGDDALFTACRMLRCLGACGQSLADLKEACPPVHMTPDLRLPVPNEERERVLDLVRTTFAGNPQSSIDGVRIEFPGGWALIRGSVTEPKLTFRFEGDSPERLDEIVREFCRQLPQLGPQLEQQYRDVMTPAQNRPAASQSRKATH